ncbi:FtsX-like permease family protein [Enterococcus entomosocium]|uniref:FtsX-like permease family protein n=1 Tax=Enterococcus entomosocium TaxID=3034352 RepID=A0ABV3MFB0_9ENTE|nr:ABC transporter permease [Enterococcus casseliflavus]MDB1707694.1 FtsX-like permease family protein [Enterococcus casseliflavus]MDB1714784.1 FtsX-like permease family protein [Enterococcus casseliflavus]
MKFNDLLKNSAKNLLRNKGRTILTIIAIFIGAFTIYLTMGINTGINNYLDQQITAVGDNSLLAVYKMDGSNNMMPTSNIQEYDPNKSSAEANVITPADMEVIESIEHIDTVKPISFLVADYIQGSSNTKYQLNAMASGDIDLELEAGRQVNNEVDGFEVILDQDYVEILGFKDAQEALEKEVTIGVSSQATGEQETLTATIVGVRHFSFVQAGRTIFNQALSQKVVEIYELGLPENLKNQSFIVQAYLEENLSSETIDTIKEALLENGFQGMTVEDEINMFRMVIDAITGVLTLFGAISLLAASFGIINTLYMSVQDRTREIGLMKALGMSRSKVFLTFSFEALLIGFFGAFSGIIAAFSLGNVINNYASSTFLEALTGFHLIGFSWSNTLTVMGIILLIAFLAGTLPANRAGKLDSIQALRYE